MKDVPFFPIIYLIKLIEVMEDEKMPVEHILDECGIDMGLHHKSPLFVSYNQMLAVVLAYLKLTTDANPGVKYGLRLELLTHGILGYAFGFKGGSFDLVKDIVGYMNVRVPLIKLMVHKQDDFFAVRIHCANLPDDVQRFVLQTFIASFYKLGSLLVPSIVIHVQGKLFTKNQQLKKILSADIMDDSEFNELRYYTRTAAPSSLNLPDLASDVHEPDLPNFVLKLRQYLLQHCETLITASQAAEHLNMSERTLRRKLADCGFSFRTVRQEVSMNMALRYLQNTSLSIERIANKCGYSDQASFAHAFQKWTGSTPDVERRKAQKKKL